MPSRDLEPSLAGKHRIAVIGLLAIYALLAMSSVREKSSAFDELFHITGGYSYWVTDDYRIHNTNGNLVQRWITLPLLAMNLNFPSTELPAWKKPEYFGFAFGDEFFYTHGNNVDAMLWNARTMVVLLGVLLGWVVNAWSRSLFGWRGGLISLTLFAFCPTVIAHGQIATSDMAASLCFSLSTWCMWRLLHRLSPWNVAASCLMVGVAAVVKFSAPLLAIVGLIMAAARLVRNRTWTVTWFGKRGTVTSRRRALPLMAVLGIAHVAATVAIVWACYGFRYSAFDKHEVGVDDFGESWSIVLALRGKTTASVIHLLRENRLLPEAFLYGAAHTLKFSESRPSYLLGECRQTGWWYFHPYCYLVKSTLSLHTLTLLGMGTVWWRWRKAAAVWGRRSALVRLYPLTPLFALLCVYWLAAITTNLNLGVRHVLPIYPAMFILAGAAGYWLRPQPTKQKVKKKMQASFASQRKVAIAIYLLLGLHILDSLQTYPNYLAYFSPVVGGPGQGHKHLVDSNLDWGQELPTLAKWLKSHDLHAQQRTPVYLEYSGTGFPNYYGIDHIPLRFYLERAVTPDNLWPLRAGVYCISATIVAAPNERVPRWSPAAEKELRELVKSVEQGDVKQTSPADFDLIRRKCGYMQFARMLAYLREREPDDDINYSIHVYYLTEKDIAQAMHGPLRELSQ